MPWAFPLHGERGEHFDGQSGLFEHLPHDRGARVLAAPHPPARQRPRCRPSVGVAGQEHAAGIACDDGDGPTGRSSRPLPSPYAPVDPLGGDCGGVIGVGPHVFETPP